ncbi:MAG: hypothetical protein PHI12_06765 [Dehalococcoidales bacterium]|nr:hypothetical protein [Dehalococcoidales bacterium]
MIYLVSASMCRGKKVSFWDSSTRHRVEHFLIELMKSPWSHYIDETWLIDTDETAEQLTDRLKPFFNGDGDFILIAKFPEEEKDYNGLMPIEQWEWIRGRRNKVSV